MLSPYTVTIYTKQDNPYNVIPDAPIEIRERLANGTSGSLSIIYSDQDGLIPITQTGAKADSNGQFTFYAAAAQYNAVYESQTVPVDVGVTVGTLPSAIINNLSLPYVFETEEDFKGFTSVFPDGKVIKLLDRDAEFVKTSGAVVADGYFTIGGVGAFQTIELVADEVYITALGAKNSQDNLPLIQAAVQTGRVIIVPKGDWSIGSGTIRLNDFQHLNLDSGANLIKRSALTSDSEPVVWVRGVGCTLQGGGLRSSFIKTENKSPSGVVRIGKESMSDASSSPISHGDISNFGIEGQKVFGQDSGLPDICINMPSPQITGNDFNYFHQIYNLYLSNCNNGIWLRGFANGLNIHNIYGVNIGTATVNDASLIYNQGGLDNAITDIFFNASPDSAGLLVDNLDNTANGSPELMVSQNNSFKGLVFEHVGTSTVGRSLVVRKSLRSNYELIDATFTGSIIPNDFVENGNTMTSTASTTFNHGRSNDMAVNNQLIVGEPEYFESSDISKDGMRVTTDSNLNYLTTDGKSSLLLNVKNPTASSRWFDFRVGGASAGAIAVNGSSSARLNLVGRLRGLQISDEFWQPVSTTGVVQDNLVALGTSSSRFKEVFAANSSINTSDARLKTEVVQLTSDEIKASKEILQSLGGWQWLAKVESEGESARVHYGATVQKAIEILESNNIDPFSKSFICYDKWDKEEQVVAETYDESGNILEPEYTIVTLKEGDRFSFRQSELILFLLAGISARLDVAGI